MIIAVSFFTQLPLSNCLTLSITHALSSVRESKEYTEERERSLIITLFSRSISPIDKTKSQYHHKSNLLPFFLPPHLEADWLYPAKSARVFAKLFLVSDFSGSFWSLETLTAVLLWQSPTHSSLRYTVCAHQFSMSFMYISHSSGWTHSFLPLVLPLNIIETQLLSIIHWRSRSKIVFCLPVFAAGFRSPV